MGDAKRKKLALARAQQDFDPDTFEVLPAAGSPVEGGLGSISEAQVGTLRTIAGKIPGAGQVVPAILKKHGADTGKLADLPAANHDAVRDELEALAVTDAAVAPTVTEAPEPENADPKALTFTVFSCRDGDSVGKTIHDDGTKETHDFPHLMEAKKKKLTLTEIAEQMMKPNVFITSGVFNTARALVVPAGMPPPEGARSPTRNRTNADMAFPSGPGLQVIDNDFADHQGHTREEVLAAIPELAGVEMVEKGSSGSYIKREDGPEVRGCTGEHVLMGAASAEDIPHNRLVIHKRLILAGFDRSFVSEGGRFLERTAADGALERRVQPTFLGALLDPGLTQDLHVRHFPGTLLQRLPDLTAEQEAEYRRLVALKHDELIPEMEEQRGQWIEKKVAEGWSRDTAIRAISGGVLGADATIILKGGKSITVADVLADPVRYHRAITLDPVEPGYRRGADVGIIYTDSDVPTLYSQAHGGATYTLGSSRRPTAEDDFGDEIDGPEALAELPPILPWGADPEAAQWLNVKSVDVGADFDLAGATVAADVALAGGLALADGRLLRLTNKKVAVKLIEAAKESGEVGAVKKVLVEKIIPAIGSDALGTLASENFRALTELGDDKASVRGALIALGKEHAAKINAFAKKMVPTIETVVAVEDPAELAARRKAQQEAAKKAEAARHADWMKSFEHIRKDPLGELRKALAAVGLAGNPNAGIMAYLTIISSAFWKSEWQVRTCLRGSPSSGKSEAMKAAVKLCPPESYHLTDGGSALSLVYKRGEGDEDDGTPGTYFVRRCLILQEADALLHDAKEGDMFQSLFKVLMSEGRLSRDVTIPGAPGQSPRVITVEQDGPTNSLTTSTHSFEPQIESRVIGYEVDQRSENTRIVKATIGANWGGASLPDYDTGPWHEYGRWLRDSGCKVSIPFGTVLAALHSDQHDIRNLNTIGSLIRTSALMNTANRETLADGTIVATIADYAVAYDLIARAADAKIGADLDESALDLFEKLKVLIEEQGVEETLPGGFTKKARMLKMPVRELAGQVGLSKSALNRKLNALAGLSGLIETHRPSSTNAPAWYWISEDGVLAIEAARKYRLPTPEQVESLCV